MRCRHVNQPVLAAHRHRWTEYPGGTLEDREGVGTHWQGTEARKEFCPTEAGGFSPKWPVAPVKTMTCSGLLRKVVRPASSEARHINGDHCDAEYSFQSRNSAGPRDIAGDLQSLDALLPRSSTLG